MDTPILVTGAAGRVGGVGRTVTEPLLTKGKPVRAMVRRAIAVLRNASFQADTSVVRPFVSSG
jgi:uncharacterized protein YbjT (DUF2867 family)